VKGGFAQLAPALEVWQCAQEATATAVFVLQAGVCRL